MKTLGLWVALMGMATTAHAAYSIKTELEVPNSKPTSGDVLVRDKEAGTILFQDMAINIESSENTKDSVKMTAQILRTENGVRRIVARPQVITKLGHPAEITQRSDDGKLVFRLKLTPTKVN